MPSITTLLVILGAAVASAAPKGLETRQAKHGFIQINSFCSKTVFYEVFHNGVGKVSSGSIVPGSPRGTGHEIDYAPNNAGLVIKASFHANPSESGPILQFEVDQNFTANAINYDISAVNGDPFKPFGSAWGVASCQNIVCPPGNDSNAFQFPGDNTKDHSCPGVNHVTNGVFCGS